MRERKKEKSSEEEGEERGREREQTKGVVTTRAAMPALYRRSIAYLQLYSVVKVRETASYVSLRNSADP